MKNYLRPYTMCTKVETEGYLLAGSPGGNAGSIKPAGLNSIKAKGLMVMALPVAARVGKKEQNILVL